MNEFIEKLIGRLEEERNKRLLFEDNATEEEAGWYFSGSRNGIADAILIVNQLAEEYNGGWISVEDALPELTEGTECFKQSPCCLVTLKWWDGDMTESVGWYNQSGVWNEDSKNCMVVAWMPLPPKYQPKGE